MFDKHFAAALCTVPEIIQQSAVIIGIYAGKSPRIEVGEWAETQRQAIYQCGAKRHFDAFDRVHDHEPELAVERVPLPDDIEGRAGGKGIVRPLEGMAVGAKPVISDGPESFDQHLAIGRQTSREDQIRLLLVRQRRLGVFHGFVPC